MNEWIVEYVAIAWRFHRRGLKDHSKKYMCRARGLKSYLIAIGKYEYPTNPT